MTGRKIAEWVGKTPDSKVPDKVRQRIFERYNKTCYLSDTIIGSKPWQLEHKVALSLGGEHRESNLAPALVDHHAIKSAAEAKIRAKADRVARKASGSRTPPKSPIQSRGLPSSSKPKREPKPSLAPRKLFA